MFNDRGDSGEEEVDNDDDLPWHIFVSAQSLNQSKSNQVSVVYIYHTNVVLILFPQHPHKCDAALNAEVIQLFLNHLVPHCH